MMSQKDTHAWDGGSIGNTLIMVMTTDRRSRQNVENCVFRLRKHNQASFGPP